MAEHRRAAKLWLRLALVLLAIWLPCAAVAGLSVWQMDRQQAEQQAREGTANLQLAAARLEQQVSAWVDRPAQELIPTAQQLCNAQTADAFDTAAKALQAKLQQVNVAGNLQAAAYYSGQYAGRLPQQGTGKVLDQAAPGLQTRLDRYLQAAGAPLLAVDGGAVYWAYGVELDAADDTRVTLELQLDPQALIPAASAPVGLIAGNAVYAPGLADAQTMVNRPSQVAWQDARAPVRYASAGALGITLFALDPPPAGMGARAVVIPVALAGLAASLVVVGFALRQHRQRRQLVGLLCQTLQLDPDTQGDDLRPLLQQVAQHLQTLSRQADLDRRLHREAELSALQHKLNPHFLYNALSTISWMAMQAGQHQLVEVVNQLARFYRASLGTAAQFSTVDQAISQIQDYLAIFAVAMDNFFETQITAPPAVRDWPILHQLLQPLVENAVVHGLEKRTDAGGLLQISFWAGQDDGLLYARVADNGAGMTPQQLEAARSTRTAGVGLSLVYERLALCYGDRAGVELQSTPGQGTQVTVWMPASPPQKPDE